MLLLLTTFIMNILISTSMLIFCKPSKAVKDFDYEEYHRRYGCKHHCSSSSSAKVGEKKANEKLVNTDTTQPQSKFEINGKNVICNAYNNNLKAEQNIASKNEAIQLKDDGTTTAVKPGIMPPQPQSKEMKKEETKSTEYASCKKNNFGN